MVQRSRSECANAVLAARHPLQLMTCILRLLELHGEKAIPVLLDLLRGADAERSDCLAWALGRLGKIAVPEILDAYERGSKRVRASLAMALWYLGPEAAKAAPLLLEDPSPQASAALLAMEGAASARVVAHRRGPVWLDDAALEEVAMLAYSDGDRGYAAVCLGCFGPSADKGLAILAHLARDPDASVRRMVVKALR